MRRGLGPPSQGAAAVHTTPIAVPISVRIGEPDISLRMLSAARGDPQWPAEVADCTGEPSAAVERQQPGRLTRLAGVYETTDWPAAKTADTCKLPAALLSTRG